MERAFAAGTELGRVLINPRCRQGAECPFQWLGDNWEEELAHDVNDQRSLLIHSKSLKGE